jgi:predicted  nucleic acid-binding Zn-ribbon protein
MEEILKQILSKLDNLEQGQVKLEQGQSHLGNQITNLEHEFKKHSGNLYDSIEVVKDSVKDIKTDTGEIKSELIKHDFAIRKIK